MRDWLDLLVWLVVYSVDIRNGSKRNKCEGEDYLSYVV
jgi:hypothetical protein